MLPAELIRQPNRVVSLVICWLSSNLFFFLSRLESHEKDDRIYFAVRDKFILCLPSIPKGFTICRFSAAAMKRKCTKCKVSGHIAPCVGCQQTFCKEHLREHRDELGHRMDGVRDECRRFDAALNDGGDILRPCLERIDRWERESISQIQRAAEQARQDLNALLDRMKTHLKTSVSKIANDTQLKEYSEIELNKWTEQLKHLQTIQKTPLSEKTFDYGPSSVALIRVVDNREAVTVDRLRPFLAEKFERISPTIKLSDGARTGTCVESNWNGSTICGSNLYVSGIHSVRFRVTKHGSQNPFFGVVSTLREPNPWKSTTPFAFGWWKIPWTVTADNKTKNEDCTIRTGDELTLTVNCTNSEIELENHRTKQFACERIAYEQCPFPWKIAIALYAVGDSISVLSE